MRSLVVGLGVQGKKRKAGAGVEFAASVDPVNRQADYAAVEDVPLESFDAALVCTPDQVKLELLEYFLSHDKHVLVEKPLLAADGAQIRRLIDIARDKKVACYTAYNHRFEPHVARLKAVLDSGVLGKVYLVKLFYGNGTARDVRDSAWRDHGAGVLPDLGSHLLDMALFWFGQPAAPFEPWSFNCFENRSFDHVFFGANGEPALQLEMTLLSWRNTFTADVFAENGSAHIHSLCKWGPSAFTLRTRVLPSGKPDQESQVLECPDPTWQTEYNYFKELCKTGETNLDNDLWINTTLHDLAHKAGAALIV